MKHLFISIIIIEENIYMAHHRNWLLSESQVFFADRFIGWEEINRK